MLDFYTSWLSRLFLQPEMGAYVTHKKELLKVSTGCLLHGFHAFILQLQRTHNSICCQRIRIRSADKIHEDHENWRRVLSDCDYFYRKETKVFFEWFHSRVREHLWKDHGEKGRYCYDHCKIANGEASCRVTVEKTVITLSQKSISLENGYTARLKAETSTGHPVTYKSARSSIASVDENGVITAKNRVKLPSRSRQIKPPRPVKWR